MPTAAAAAAAEPRVDATNDATTATAMGNASTPNAGSTAATANALGALGGGKNLSVLLVEDDHSTLVFVKAMLRSCGHSGASPRAVFASDLASASSSPDSEQISRVDISQRPRSARARFLAPRPR